MQGLSIWYLVSLAVCVSGGLLHFITQRKSVWTRGQAGEVFWLSFGACAIGFVPFFNIALAVLLIGSALYEHADKFFPNLED